MGTAARGIRRAGTALLALAAIVAIGGCGGEDPVDKSEVTLKVRPEGSPERQLLGQIYAQALRQAGYRVKNAPPAEFGSTIAYDELKEGKLSGYPEYLSTILFYKFGVEIADIPSKTKPAYKQARAKFEKEDLTAFPPAPYSIENVVGMLRETAQERKLKTISDLKGQAEEMTIKGPTYCHVSVECVGGIEVHYDTAFESISYEAAATPELTWWRAEPEYRYQVLEKGVSDASILFNTDGRLATEGKRFAVLEDDKDVFPASNFVWVTSSEVVEEAGPDYEKAILDAQKGLTLETIQELNAELEVGKKPAVVAAEYLKSIR
ncbi:MAG TPA: glycine betaine ABC transporter substrate-binding protein [Solirubrobacterales bacterium]